MPEICEQLKVMNKQMKTSNNLVKTFINMASSMAPGRTEVSVDVPPQNVMQKGLKTVAAIWKEWSEGLDGKPSLQSLNNKWGTKWRSSAADRKLYSNRLQIIKEIQKRSGNNPVQLGIQELEDLRMDNGTGIKRSIEWLRKYILEKNKSRDKYI